MTELVAAAGAVAVLELDATAAGQFMVSRPVVVGPVLGAAFGQPALGAGIGALWELLSLDEVPVGGHLPINATVAAGATLLLCLGLGGVTPEAAVACGAAAGLVHRGLETRLRQSHAACAARCDKRIADGSSPRIGRAAVWEMTKQACVTFAVLGAVVALRPWLAGMWSVSPDVLQVGMSFGLAVGPWLGIAALIQALKVLA